MKLLKTHKARLLLLKEVGGGMGKLYKFSKVSGLCIKNASYSSHAGGPAYKPTISPVSKGNAIVSSSAVSGEVAASSSEDGGDGDSDPDSDGKKKPRLFQSSSTAHIQRIPSNRILRMPELIARIGLSRSTIYEAISKGNFPPSISLGARAVGWLESDVDHWIEERASSFKTT